MERENARRLAVLGVCEGPGKKGKRGKGKTNQRKVPKQKSPKQIYESNYQTKTLSKKAAPKGKGKGKGKPGGNAPMPKKGKVQRTAKKPWQEGEWSGQWR